jgi:hypothetical protein
MGRKGGIASGITRRERGKSVRQRLAEKLEADADSIYQAFRTAYLAGDYKAAEAALNQGFGRPPQDVELSGPGGGPVEITLVSAFSQDDDEDASGE